MLSAEQQPSPAHPSPGVHKLPNRVTGGKSSGGSEGHSCLLELLPLAGSVCPMPNLTHSTLCTPSGHGPPLHHSRAPERGHSVLQHQRRAWCGSEPGAGPQHRYGDITPSARQGGAWAPLHSRSSYGQDSGHGRHFLHPVCPSVTRLTSHPISPHFMGWWHMQVLRALDLEGSQAQLNAPLLLLCNSQSFLHKEPLVFLYVAETLSLGVCLPSSAQGTGMTPSISRSLLPSSRFSLSTCKCLLSTC